MINQEINTNNICPYCNGELFENEYKDIQCESCYCVIPFKNQELRKLKQI